MCCSYMFVYHSPEAKLKGNSAEFIRLYSKHLWSNHHNFFVPSPNKAVAIVWRLPNGADFLLIDVSEL